ncbi:MAG: hypothetical protein ABS76_26295 [Pelagibacterium sp. SCN 64-44]|nr:MAG: hypothetical protein ABS76_26295 [Pelagibacterium sp. SCN 64-44]
MTFTYHAGQLVAQREQAGDASFDFLKLSLCNAARVLARCFGLLLQSQQHPNTWQIETKIAGMADKAQPLCIDGAVSAPSVGLAGRLGQNPDALVIADCFDVHACLSG